MNIAVIGGGASGIVTAHLLGDVHNVTLIEREPMLGGNIRTLNRNVPCPALDSGTCVDAGVIEFERDKFPAFHVLMEELGIELGDVPGTSGLFLANGRSYLSPGDIRGMTRNPLVRAREFLRLIPLARSRKRFMERTAGVSAQGLVSRPVSDYLDDSVFSLWVRLLLMYAYSTPASEVDDFPAALAVPMLRDFLGAGRWTRINGGVYTYIERILEGFGGKVLLETHVSNVRRKDRGIELAMASGETLQFGAVVFATTPDQVLTLLADPSEAEVRRFGAWESRSATTVVHTDVGLYRRRKIPYPSEFDLFEKANGRYGYNAYLNRLTGLGEEWLPHYQLGFDMDEEIDPTCVVHRQQHITPHYTVEAFRSRDEVAATNGEAHTFHAGAYLGDGLHEGAVRSANEVSRLLGGHVLCF